MVCINLNKYMEERNILRDLILSAIFWDIVFIGVGFYIGLQF